MWFCVVILIISVRTLSSAKEVNTTVFVCGHGSTLRHLNSEEFKCRNGTGCILMENICNGVPDCPDGSDEVICPYHTEESNVLALNRSKRQISCGDNQWHCSDEYCITKNNVCNGVADCYDGSDEAVEMCNRPPSENTRTCVLPPYPDHGTYEASNLLNAQPGEAYASFSLKVICQRGHGILEPFDDGGGTAQVYCINGEWSQNMPKCDRFCKLDPNPSIRYMCLSQTGVGVCKKYLPSGTLVQPVCNNPIYYSTETFTKMRCDSGYWNYVAVCKTECGRITPSGNQLVIGGTLAKRGELPWHAGIYTKTTMPYMQICGGSLVSNNVVISAAHCFWKDISKLLPASEFGVAMGKLYRSWDSDKDAGAQKSDVKEIKIPILFEGEAANFQEDLAVLVLSTPVTYTTYIRPVCLNFNLQFDRLQLQHGKLGKVAGWGLTASNGKVSPALKVVDIPFINAETCISTIPLSFREYITGDKFCAGYTNGTAALCQGDSGGGLAFSDKEFGIDRYYLRGVVSTAPNEDDKLCNDNTYITFTKIAKHQEFIQEALAASVGKICPLYSFQCSDGSCRDPGSECDGKPDCADGSDESDEYCLVGRTRIAFQQPLQRQNFENPVTSPAKLQTPYPVQQLNSPRTQTRPAPRPLSIEGVQFSSESNTNCDIIPRHDENGFSFYNGRPYERGDLPWMVAIFRKIDNSYRFQCAGTLISNRHVITGAHVVYQHQKFESIKSFLVKLGALDLDDFEDDNIKNRSLISMSVIDSFNPKTFKNDISILTLNIPVEFNMFIRPACLWNGNQLLSKIVGKVGVFGGWGKQIHDAPSSGKLPRILTLPIVSTSECRASNQVFQILTSDRTLCAGYRNGSTPCLGDCGGGLFLLHEGKYIFRGLLSIAIRPKSETQKCSLYEYVLFTDVATYLPWIKKVISETHYD